MKFKGTIIITDPCYIIKKYQKPKFSTWPGLEEVKGNTPFTNYTEKQRQAYEKYQKACNEFYKKYDDWSKCHYGKNMEALGITHYITKDTLYGDWSCTTYSANNPKKIVDDLAEIDKYFNDKYEEYGGYKVITDEQYKSLRSECDIKQDALNLKTKNIGYFCADAGLVSVFLLDEVKKYNPEIEKWIAEHRRCVTIIEDFDGNIEYYVDKANDAHIIGTGSLNFFTTQTEL